MVSVKFLHPRATWEHVGMIPGWLDSCDPSPAAQQLNARYRHGGGWQPFKGHVLRDDDSIKYPGDPPLNPFAEMRLREERILMYPGDWVVIIQPDRSYEICRMD